MRPSVAMDDDSDLSDRDGWETLGSFGLYTPKVHPTDCRWPSLGAFEPHLTAADFFVRLPFEPIYRALGSDAYWAAKRVAEVEPDVIDEAVSAGRLTSFAARPARRSSRCATCGDHGVGHVERNRLRSRTSGPGPRSDSADARASRRDRASWHVRGACGSASSRAPRRSRSHPAQVERRAAKQRASRYPAPEPIPQLRHRPHYCAARWAHGASPRRCSPCARAGELGGCWCTPLMPVARRQGSNGRRDIAALTSSAERRRESLGGGADTMPSRCRKDYVVACRGPM